MASAVPAVPAVLVGLSAGLQQALWVALLYLGVQMFESYGITPLIQRRVLRIPPALLVLFQLMMASLRSGPGCGAGARPGSTVVASTSAAAPSALSRGSAAAGASTDKARGKSS
jgi:hypothetical protein